MIINIGTNNALDGLTSIAVEFIYIEPKYRNRKIEDIDSKLSEFIILDYIIGEIGITTKKTIGINQVILTPINEKVRKLYEEMGFISIKNSGKNEFEDWMLFNI